MKTFDWNEWNFQEFQKLGDLAEDPTKALIHNKLGRLFWVSAGDKFFMQRMGPSSGPYQGRNLKFLRDLVPNARTILDIGMNIGQNTIEYATWAQAVHGFEPFPDTFKMAKANVELNQNVKLKGKYGNALANSLDREPDVPNGWYPAEGGQYASLDMTAQVFLYNQGVGASAGVLEMKGIPNNAGQNHMRPTNTKGKEGNSILYETVAVTTIDSHNFSDVDIIKIDVEGFELFVLQGAENTIREYKPVLQVEIADNAKRFNYHVNDIYNFLIQHIGGYKCYDYAGNLLSDEYTRIKGNCDRFFVPNTVPVKTHNTDLFAWK
jgi:FkbM family methyltransferase